MSLAFYSQTPLSLQYVLFLERIPKLHSHIIFTVYFTMLLFAHSKCRCVKMYELYGNNMEGNEGIFFIY